MEFETCWLETTSKGSDGSFLVFTIYYFIFQWHYYLYYVLHICIFMLLDVGSQTVMNIVSSTLNKLKWIEKAQKVFVVKLRAMYALSMRME